MQRRNPAIPHINLPQAAYPAGSELGYPTSPLAPQPGYPSPMALHPPQGLAQLRSQTPEQMVSRMEPLGRDPGSARRRFFQHDRQEEGVEEILSPAVERRMKPRTTVPFVVPLEFVPRDHLMQCLARFREERPEDYLELLNDRPDAPSSMADIVAEYVAVCFPITFLLMIIIDCRTKPSQLR